MRHCFVKRSDDDHDDVTSAYVSLYNLSKTYESIQEDMTIISYQE